MTGKSIYSSKVLELVARETANYFTGTEIVQILTDFGMAREHIQYPNTKWWTINEAFKYIKANHEKPEDSISKLIMDFLHPLSHNLNEESASSLANKVGKYLKYDNFSVQETGDDYSVFSDEEMSEMFSNTDEDIQKYEEDEKFKNEALKRHTGVIRKLRDSHQAYIDVIELFCRNPKRPTKELNDAYLFLSKKIESSIKEMNLNSYGVPFYKPFRNDLYSAEIEWNGTGRMDDIRLGPSLSWDAIRPSLYRSHSEILRVLAISEEGAEMTDDDKKLEEITNIISKARTPVPRPIVKAPVHKIEITNPELVFRNAEEVVISKGKKRVYPPHFKSTPWEKITIRFVDDQNVVIDADKKQSIADYQSLGFEDGKKKKPDTAWKMLLGLARNDGKTQKLSSPIPETIRQQKSKLSARLKAIFKNESDPFDDVREDDVYRIRVKLIPPQVEEVKPQHDFNDLLTES